jgi:hypothetical protein
MRKHRYKMASMMMRVGEMDFDGEVPDNDWAPSSVITQSGAVTTPATAFAVTFGARRTTLLPLVAYCDI